MHSKINNQQPINGWFTHSDRNSVKELRQDFLDLYNKETGKFFVKDFKGQLMNVLFNLAATEV